MLIFAGLPQAAAAAASFRRIAVRRRGRKICFCFTYLEIEPSNKNLAASFLLLLVGSKEEERSWWWYLNSLYVRQDLPARSVVVNVFWFYPALPELPVHRRDYIPSRLEQEPPWICCNEYILLSHGINPSSSQTRQDDNINGWIRRLFQSWVPLLAAWDLCESLR